MEKRYYYVVKLEFNGTISAKTKKEAIKRIKASFLGDNNIDLIDEEIEINYLVSKKKIKVK